LIRVGYFSTFSAGANISVNVQFAAASEPASLVLLGAGLASLMLIRSPRLYRP
jgi:hypothetical protein